MSVLNENYDDLDFVLLLMLFWSMPCLIRTFVIIYDNEWAYSYENSCDTSSKPVVNVLIGSAPDVKPVQPELVKELSEPGRKLSKHI
jgi:hypothetical protein